MAAQLEKAVVYYFLASSEKAAKDEMQAKVAEAKAILKAILVPSPKNVAIENVQTHYQIRKDVEKQSRGRATYPVTYVDNQYVGDLNQLREFAKQQRAGGAPVPDHHAAQPAPKFEQAQPPSQPGLSEPIQKGPIQSPAGPPIGQPPAQDEDEWYTDNPKERPNVAVESPRKDPPQRRPSAGQEAPKPAPVKYQDPDDEELPADHYGGSDESPPAQRASPRRDSRPAHSSHSPQPPKAQEQQPSTLLGTAMSTLGSTAKNVMSWWYADTATAEASKRDAQLVEQQLERAKANDHDRSLHFAVTRVNPYGLRQLRVLRLSRTVMQRLDNGVVKAKYDYLQIKRIERRGKYDFDLITDTNADRYNSVEADTIIENIRRLAGSHNIPVAHIG